MPFVMTQTIAAGVYTGCCFTGRVKQKRVQILTGWEGWRKYIWLEAQILIFNFPFDLTHLMDMLSCTFNVLNLNKKVLLMRAVELRLINELLTCVAQDSVSLTGSHQPVHCYIRKFKVSITIVMRQQQ